jgi:NAD(P)-dependent dehydrogenase (short-subunit alcohol dehydrogenase family)
MLICMKRAVVRPSCGGEDDDDNLIASHLSRDLKHYNHHTHACMHHRRTSSRRRSLCAATNAHVRLASPAAGYVTGQTIVVDGGLTIA